MTEKKQAYLTPRMEVVRVQQTEIICNGSNYASSFSVDNNEIELGQNDVWGGDLDW